MFEQKKNIHKNSLKFKRNLYASSSQWNAGQQQMNFTCKEGLWISNVTSCRHRVMSTVTWALLYVYRLSMSSKKPGGFIFCNLHLRRRISPSFLHVLQRWASWRRSQHCWWPFFLSKFIQTLCTWHDKRSFLIMCGNMHKHKTHLNTCDDDSNNGRGGGDDDDYSGGQQTTPFWFKGAHTHTV